MSTITKEIQGYRLHANDFKKMLLGASYFFEREKENINALNVFPVPDGDTGTNMSMTINAAVEGSLSYEGHSIGELSEIVASRALMGARGNSGVILSQILRGIAHGLQKKDYTTPAELSKAFQYGVVYAYKAVSTPVEGTILTVAREMARGIRNAARQGENLYDSLEEAIKNGKAALDKTTMMLPALKEAGVVDAGGLGLLVFLEGFLFAMKKSLNDMLSHKKTAPVEQTLTGVTNTPPLKPTATEKPPNLLYPYCTEMIIKNEKGDYPNLKAKLSPLGDSLIVAADNRMAKLHIHTASPDLVMQLALQFGSLHDIKIDNMHDQQEEHKLSYSSNAAMENPAILPNTEKTQQGEAGIIAVSFGEGFREIFLSLGADKIVFGGQTMNPNVRDLLQAVHNLPQQKAIILPNNKNIIMVAEQVKALSHKHVEVLETKSLPEGLTALLTYNLTLPIEDNVTAMQESVSQVKTGLITYATRDTIIKGEAVKAGQYLGLAGDNIVTSTQNLHQTALNLATQILDEEKDIITVFYNQDIEWKEASTLTSAIQEKYPSLEVELQYGGQPIYYYIFSVE